MHSEGIIHGDLKGVSFHVRTSLRSLTCFVPKANILIDQRGHASLADFGLTTIISESVNSANSSSSAGAGTPRWMSPELLDPDHSAFQDSRRTNFSDCYALGMVILEVLSGQVPFARYNGLIVTQVVTRGELPERPNGIWFTDDLWGMLQACWSLQPENRPTVKAVFEYLERISPTWQPLPPNPAVDPRPAFEWKVLESQLPADDPPGISTDSLAVNRAGADPSETSVGGIDVVSTIGGLRNTVQGVGGGKYFLVLIASDLYSYLFQFRGPSAKELNRKRYRPQRLPSQPPRQCP